MLVARWDPVERIACGASGSNLVGFKSPGRQRYDAIRQLEEGRIAPAKSGWRLSGPWTTLNWWRVTWRGDKTNGKQRQDSAGHRRRQRDWKSGQPGAALGGILRSAGRTFPSGLVSETGRPPLANVRRDLTKTWSTRTTVGTGSPPSLHCHDVARGCPAD